MTELDPLNINPRLQAWISELIDNRDDMTVSEQVRAVAAIARIQYLFMKLREEKSEPVNTGVAVKQYEKAFQANATRRRKKLTGSTTAVLTTIRDDDDELEY